MESWVLQGDSYSFLPSAAHNFTLEHLDGPNRVEIFDITSIPSARNAISETTCLCDIFGDDCESPTLSSSPTSASILKKNVEETIQADDVNSSPGSYHTANGSEHLSIASETFEDSKDSCSTPSNDFSLETNDPSYSPCHLNLSNNTDDNNGSVNSALVSFKVDDSSPSQAENQQVSYIPHFDNLCEAENLCDLQLLTATIDNGLITPTTANDSDLAQGQNSHFFEETSPGKTKDFHSPEQEIPNTLQDSIIHSILVPENMDSTKKSGIASPDSQQELITNLIHETGEGTELSASESQNAKSTQEIPSPETFTDIKHYTEKQEILTSSNALDSAHNQEIISSNYMDLKQVIITPGLSNEIRCVADQIDVISLDVQSDFTKDNIQSKEQKILLSETFENSVKFFSQDALEETTSVTLPNEHNTVGVSIMDKEPLCLSYITNDDSFCTEDILVDTEKEEYKCTVDLIKISSNVALLPDCAHSQSDNNGELVNYSSERVKEPTTSKDNDTSAITDLENAQTMPLSTFDSSNKTKMNAHQCPTIPLESNENRGLTPLTDATEGWLMSEWSDLFSLPDSATSSMASEILSLNKDPATVLSDPPSPSTLKSCLTPATPDNLETQDGLPRPLSCSRDPMNPIIEEVNCYENFPASTDLIEAQETSDILVKHEGEFKPLSILSNPVNLLLPEVKGPTCSESFESTTVLTKDTLPTSYVQSSLLRDTVSSPKIKDQTSIYVLTEQIPVSGSCISLGHKEHDIPQGPIFKNGVITMSEVEVISLLEPSDKEQLMETDYKSSKDCISTMDECTIIAETPCSQIQETRAAATELPVTISNSTKISLERSHGSMTDLLAGVSEEIRLKENSASNEMQHSHGESPSDLKSTYDSKFENYSFKNKGWSGEMAIYNELSSVGGFIVEGPSSGEQAVLSINTRNRKESAQLSPELSSRDTKSGIPAHYFESPPTNHQQQTLVGEHTFQKENNYGAKLSSTSQRNNGGDIRQECTSGTFNLESKIDEVDNEAKRSPELVFMRPFSSEGDYLDVGHNLFTHVSQPSTVNSLGASTCMSYADLSNKSLHETEDLLGHCSTFLPNDILKPRKSLDVDSFECVDVIVESKAEKESGKKTVPKRQIQFKRQLKNQNVDTVVNTENVRDFSCNVTIHQQDTPVSVQDLVQGESEINNGKKMLQQSASLDETSTKTDKASSIIKNVLSRKIDVSTKSSLSNKSSSSSENENIHSEILIGEKSSNIEFQSSSTFCDLRSSPNDYHVADKIPDIPKKKNRPKIPPKLLPKPKCVPLHIINGGVGLYDIYPVGHDVSTSHFESSEGKPSRNEMSETNKTEERHVEERHNHIPTSFLAKSTNCAVSKPSLVTNIETDQTGVPEIPRQQDRGMFLSKTTDITLKNFINKDKKIALIKSPVPLDTRVIKEPECQSECLPKDNNKLNTKADNYCQKEGEKKPKPIMDNVTAKNTQSVSFNATNTIDHKEDFQNPKQIQHCNPLRIEYKAISWKNKQSACSKATNLQDKTDNLDKSKVLHVNSVMTQKTPKESLVTLIKSQEQQEKVVKGPIVDFFVGSNNILLGSPDNSERKMELKPPPRPSSKDASTLVLLSEGTSKTKQNPASSCSSEEKNVCNNHCVAMLLKEKGMQADIGVCDAIHQETEAQSKHVNRLEVPLLTYSSEETTKKSQKVQNIAVTSHQVKPTDKSHKSNESGKVVRCSPEVTNIQSEVGENKTKASLLSTNELEKMTGHSISMPKIVPPVAASYKAEMRSFSSSTKSHAVPVTTSKEIELPIQVRSISNDRTKPSSVLSKASQKLPVAEIKSVSTNSSKQDVKAISFLKQHAIVKEDDITEKSSTSKNNGHSNEGSNTKSINVTSSAIYALTPPPLSCKHSSSVQLTSNQEQQHLPTNSCQSVYQAPLPVSQAVVKPRPETSASNQFHSEDFHFHSSDDPPSYDERERFSSLMLTDLTQIELNKYHPATRPSLCSCSTCSQSHFRQTYRRSQSQSPQASHLPMKIISYSGAQLQPQAHSFQCRSDSQSNNYPSISPKTAPPQASAMIQPLHISQSCRALAKHPFGTEQQQLSNEHMDKRPGHQHSPHVSGASYQEHRGSPNVTAMDPRAHVFSQQALQPFEQDYGSDGPVNSGILYPDNVPGLVYGQGSRRVLLDPETGKYFYIDVPIHPIRKMLYDPEIGQYVEVVIPQQSMSHPGMYPSTATSYPPLHCPPQYLSYAVPPHIQSAQQPQLSDPAVPTSLNQISAGYKNSAAQIPKLDIKGHQPQDQNYLENMYYLPTGINTSPNSNALDCYHKPSTNMPAAGGRRA